MDNLMADLNPEESKASFQSRMDQTVLSGYTMAGISLASTLGLFKVFGDDAMTAVEVANKSGCKERYIREWLHHMVVCDIIQVDETGTQFTLPRYRRDVLLDRGTLVGGMFTPVFNYTLIPHKDIVQSFKTDGPIGVPFDRVRSVYDEYSRQSGSDQLNGAKFMLENISSLKEKLDAGISVAEIGFGEGAILLHLASLFPRSSFTGFDLSEAMLEKATEAKRKAGLQNISFALQDASDLPEELSNTFDLIFMCDVLHDISYTSKALEGIYRCLKPGGQLSVHDVDVFQNPYDNLKDPTKKILSQMMYTVSMYHCLPASLNTPGSQGLGACSGIENIIRLIRKAGFYVDEKNTKPINILNAQILGEKPE